MVPPHCLCCGVHSVRHALPVWLDKWHLGADVSPTNSFIPLSPLPFSPQVHQGRPWRPRRLLLDRAGALWRAGGLGRTVLGRVGQPGRFSGAPPNMLATRAHDCHRLPSYPLTLLHPLCCRLQWLKFDNSYFKDIKEQQDAELLVLPTDACIFEDEAFK